LKALALVVLAAIPAFAQGGGVYRVGGGVTAPALLHKVEPVYSEEARKAKYQGTVVLYVEVNPEGLATNVRVVRALGLGLDEKAIEAVRQWQFKPGTKDGKAVTVAATIEVNFRLLNTGWNVLQQAWTTEPDVTKPALRAAGFPEECKTMVSAKLSLEITSEGVVRNAKVVRTDDPAMGEALVAAVQKWSFEPARWKGAPLPASGEIELGCTPQ
jgi:TonB family protein